MLFLGGGIIVTRDGEVLAHLDVSAPSLAGLYVSLVQSQKRNNCAFSGLRHVVVQGTLSSTNDMFESLLCRPIRCG